MERELLVFSLMFVGGGISGVGIIGIVLSLRTFLRRGVSSKREIVDPVVMMVCGILSCLFGAWIFLTKGEFLLLR
jgi:hypothetical protein